MTPPGIELATFRFVAQHLSHCATAVPQAHPFTLEYYGLYGFGTMSYFLDCAIWISEFVDPFFTKHYYDYHTEKNCWGTQAEREMHPEF